MLLQGGKYEGVWGGIKRKVMGKKYSMKILSNKKNFNTYKTCYIEIAIISKSKNSHFLPCINGKEFFWVCNVYVSDIACFKLPIILSLVKMLCWKIKRYFDSKFVSFTLGVLTKKKNKMPQVDLVYRSVKLWKFIKRKSTFWSRTQSVT